MDSLDAENDLRPRLAWTLGDVAGIGPELVIKAWHDPAIHEQCRPLVIGSAEVLRRYAGDAGIKIIEVDRPTAVSGWPIPSANQIPCFDPTSLAVESLTPGRVHALAGQAAYDYLVAGIELAQAGTAEGIVTLPLHKEGLHAAGLDYPGHTEILAEKTGTKEFGMMLYRRGLGVLHVTLHVSVARALAAITTEAVAEKIRLIDLMMRTLGHESPRIAVCALNPHAGDGGLFGDEESRVIAPAIEQSRAEGIDVRGPLPADTLFVRAAGGEFDGVVAMLHDQGHIALKLLGWREAVNITVGLPIVRVSVAHGTAYDIVGRNLADPTSLVEAVTVASRLCRSNALKSSSP